MKPRNTKRKIIETAVGAAVGAAIAGPAGAFAGGLAGSQVAAHTSRIGKAKRPAKPGAPEPDDPIVHAPLNCILVPVDFSAPSRQALRFAREWGARFGSQIVLLHVVEPANALAAFGLEPVASLVVPVDFRDQAQAELRRLMAEEFSPSEKVSMQLREGAPYDQIAQAAREVAADVIIIATHGRTGLSRALLGSTAERVVRHAPCPVLTLRRAERA